MISEPSPAWHTLTTGEVTERLRSSPTGLAAAEAARRLQEVGPNELRATRRTSPWSLLLAQFRSALILILLVATGLSALLGHELEAVAITVIVVVAVLLGFVQEFRAERAMEALRKMTAPHATALRDGEVVLVAARTLVPGDVLVLGAGDLVAADARLLAVVDLHVQQSALTGESAAVAKHADALADPELALGDRSNLVHAGTTVSYGKGRAVVVATGMQTEFGRIAGMLQSVAGERTPLQRNLDALGRNLARAALGIVALVVLLGLLRGQPLVEMLVFGTALAVAVVPEALPAVVTITLALGVTRLAKRRALVRRLAAVETLGATSVICTDKTGTLTRDEMTARQMFVTGRSVDVTGVGYRPEGSFVCDGRTIDLSPASADPLALPLRQLLRAGALAGDADLVHADERGDWRLRGEPTEGALVVAAAKAGLRKQELEAAFPRIAEIPFSSEAKRMTTVHRTPAGTVAFGKGAPEVIVAACTTQATVAGTAPLDDEGRAGILAAAHAMADRALRVLAVAMRADAADVAVAAAERGMTFLGLVGMIDPPRDEAKPALAQCRDAGIGVVMITGDHPTTATAVARELDLLPGGRVITGAQLDAMDDATLRQEAPGIAVYARVSPLHKLRVVAALQHHGHVVAMTGDGVNDAPALEQADIGIAMGRTGTDVARQAAAITLTDDDFATIVAAVRAGRAIFANIRKCLLFLLASNTGEIGLMVATAVLDLPLPLTAVQILYVNLATDGLPALALAVDPADPALMRRRPRNPRAGIFTRPFLAQMLLSGAWTTIAIAALYAWLLHGGRPQHEAMAMTFAALVLIQFGNAFSFRAERSSALRALFANRWLCLAVLWEAAALAALFHVPLLQEPFGTFAMGVWDWTLVVAVAATVVPVLELGRLATRRSRFARAD